MPISERDEHNVGILIVHSLWRGGDASAGVAPDTPPIGFALFTQDPEDEKGGDDLREVDCDGALERRGEHVRPDLE